MIVAPDVWLSSLTNKLPEDQKDSRNLTIYACLVTASLIFAIIRAYGFLFVSLRCSERLHDKMVLAILQAPVLFFDSNPVGRILNRFSKDVGCLDELLPKTFLLSIQRVLLAFATIIVPTVTNPWLLFLVIPLIVLVLYISKYYLKTSRELKRLESIFIFLFIFIFYLFILPHHKYNENSKRKNIKNGFNNGEETQRKL